MTAVISILIMICIFLRAHCSELKETLFNAWPYTQSKIEITKVNVFNFHELLTKLGERI